MRRWMFIILASLLLAPMAHAALCVVPCGDPHPWACYEAKVPGQLALSGALEVPALGLTVALPPALPVLTRRVCTPACRPGDACPDLDGGHLVGHEGWPLPGLGDLPVTLDTGTGAQAVRLSRGGFVLATAAKRIAAPVPPALPLAQVYACWTASGPDKREIAYRDQFGDGVARTHQLAQVCLGASYGGVTGGGALACYRTRRNTLPDAYVPRQRVWVTPSLGAAFDTALEGLDEFCLAATVTP